MTVPERQWDSMSPGEKQSWLLNQALDCKRDILTMPLPDPDDYSAEAIRMRALILAAADSTIEQTIRLRTNQLAPAPSDGMAEIIEERRLAAMAAIEKMAGKPPTPNSGDAGTPGCGDDPPANRSVWAINRARLSVSGL